ncbi:putative gmp synthase [glutamine-hydrolyzing], partial [Quercus suber]
IHGMLLFMMRNEESQSIMTNYLPGLNPKLELQLISFSVLSIHDTSRILFELLSLSGRFFGTLTQMPFQNTMRTRYTPGSLASSLLSEVKLRAIIDNANQMCKVIDRFGSFSKYMWNFVNHKPIVSQFRYSRQVPVKTPNSKSRNNE